VAVESGRVAGAEGLGSLGQWAAQGAIVVTVI